MSQQLEQFNALVDQFATLQGWIDKAMALAAQYRPEVVERVVNGHAHTRDELAVEIVPLTTAIEETLSAAKADAATATAIAADTNAKIDELNLRHLIGEIDDAGLAEESSTFNEEAAAAAAALAAADESVAAIELSLARWNELGRSAGVLQ